MYGLSDSYQLVSASESATSWIIKLSLDFTFSFSSVVITVVGMLMLLDGGISSTNS